jgi:hypothetical protein
MPNRIIKESILTSESIDALNESAEILHYRLLVNADDQGRFMASPSSLASALFPLKTEKMNGQKLAALCRQIAADCRKLSEVGIIKLYTGSGRQYGYFPTWHEHQRIRNVRPKYAKPPKDDNDNNDLVDLPQSADNSPQNDDSLPQSVGKKLPESESESESESEGKKEKLAPENIIYLWNDLADNTLPSVRQEKAPKTFETCISQIRQRTKDRKWKNAEPWRMFFERVLASSFLTGQVDSVKGPFKATLEWITRPTNMEKIEAGNYDDKKQGKSNFQVTWQSSPEEQAEAEAYRIECEKDRENKQK